MRTNRSSKTARALRRPERRGVIGPDGRRGQIEYGIAYDGEGCCRSAAVRWSDGTVEQHAARDLVLVDRASWPEG